MADKQSKNDDKIEAFKICDLTEETIEIIDDLIDFVDDEKISDYDDEGGIGYYEYLTRKDKREAEEMIEEIQELWKEIQEIGDKV